MSMTTKLNVMFVIIIIFEIFFTWWINSHASTEITTTAGWGISINEQPTRGFIKKATAAAEYEQSTSSSSGQKKLASFTVDILSVGSINQLELLHAQKRTFGSHISVRNFFNVTEMDDADPNCHTDIQWEQVKQVSDYCRNKKKSRGNIKPVYRTLLSEYARWQWLQKKHNPVGWLCAQPRPYAGFRKAYMHYNRTGEKLPNYFIVMDDDTYYNLEWFQTTMEALDDTSRDSCYAGCLVRKPIHMINFTFPYGGFGTILGQGVLRKMLQPIHCPVSYFDDNINGNTPVKVEKESLVVDICNRLKENNVEELQYFTNGMNLIELMYKYTSTDMYRNVSTWSNDLGSGFCMHSDWVIGYFMNYYNMSNHVINPFYKDVPHSRMEEFQGSEIYGSRKKGFCKQDDMKDCEHGSKICHRVSPEWMELEVQTAYKT